MESKIFGTNQFGGGVNNGGGEGELMEPKVCFVFDKTRRFPGQPEEGDVPTNPKVLVDVDNLRLDGNGWGIWMYKMDYYVTRNNLKHVLRVPCPRVKVAPEASPEEIALSKAAEQTWKRNDSLCFYTILNHLSDDLFAHYSNKPKTTARQLWDELKLRFRSPKYLVREYLEFPILEEQPVVEQALELNSTWDLLLSHGMAVDEQFHINLLISKLPASWEDVCVELMRKEEHLTLAVLMQRLRAEEESRMKEQKQKQALK